MSIGPGWGFGGLGSGLGFGTGSGFGLASTAASFVASGAAPPQPKTVTGMNSDATRRE